MKKKLIVAFVCMGITGVIGFRLVSNKKKIDEKKRSLQVDNIRIPVTTVTAGEEMIQAGMVKTGTLAPFKEAKVLSVTSGNVQRLLFNPGDNVREEQTLAIIDTRLLAVDLQQSESNVVKLRRDLQTYTALLAGNAATQEKVNEISQNYDDAMNKVERLQRQIADASIKAPTSGIIANKAVEEGMFVTAGTEIASIVDLSKLKVQVNLTEAEVYQVKPGQKINLTTDVYPNKSFSGTITFISPQANQAYNYKVEITASNDKHTPLRSGTFVYADFSKTTSKKVLLIPRQALNESTQHASVYVVKDGKAILRNIQIAGEYGSNVHVAGGLHPGEEVITSGQINLQDGTLINISN